MSFARMMVAALGLPATVLAACGPSLRYTSAPLGNYDMYRPFAELGGVNSLNVELQEDGYVTVISVFADPDRPEIPVVFAPWYPANGEESFLRAGKHRVRHDPPPDMPPRECTAMEKPSESGCRRPVSYYLPDVRNPAIQQRSPQNYFVVVTQSPLDPYELADDLYHATLADGSLDRLLRAYDSTAAAPALEKTLLERRGPIVLAGVYVTLQLNGMEQQ